MNALRKWLPAAICLMAALAQAAPSTEFARQIRFAVIQQPGSDAALQEALTRAVGRNPRFVVVNGIKAAAEPCTDAVYLRRKSLLNESAAPLVASLAGSDWIECRGDDGKLNEVERLQRLRELYFDGDASLGASRIRLVRQSITARFRGFPENAYWQRGKILFATIHLPAENNHYLTAAGRNSEFEDRLIANRHWLQRIFNLARLHKMRGIVLFADGNPMAPPASGISRDGFAEMRKLLAQLAPRFAGRVLLVHGHAAQSAAQISWRDNLGTVGARTGGLEIVANPSSTRVFSIVRERSGGRR